MVERIEVEVGKWNGVQVWSRVVLNLLIAVAYSAQIYAINLNNALKYWYLRQ